MTTYFTQKRKVHPIRNSQRSVGSFQTGTAHLSVPKRLSKKPSILKDKVDNRSSMQKLVDEQKQKEDIDKLTMPIKKAVDNLSWNSYE